MRNRNSYRHPLRAASWDSVLDLGCYWSRRSNQHGFSWRCLCDRSIGAVGVALVLGGVSQLISPTPQLGTIGPLGGVGGSGRRQTSTEGTEFDPQESYSFSGIQNTSKQGVPVPVVYGETIVGSVVISAGIDVDTI
jgi:predicted phage tail protein